MPWLRSASKWQQRYPGSPCVSSEDRLWCQWLSGSMSHIPGEPAPGWLYLEPTLPAAPPHPALHGQEQVSCVHRADGVSSICTSEGRADVRGTGDGSQPLHPEQQFSSVGLSLFKEWCNQTIDYLWLMSPSTYLCLWKSSQNLLTCDYSSGTPFSQLKWKTCFPPILAFTAITFCAFLFLILQRERGKGVQAGRLNVYHLPAPKYRQSSADVIHCLMTLVLLQKLLGLKIVSIKKNWQTVCFFSWLNRMW